MSGITVNFESPKVFEISSCLTWGIEKSKFKNGGYNVPLCIEDDAMLQQLLNLEEEHETKKVMRGSKGTTIYLSVGGLSSKQKTELLDAGRLYVNVIFECNSVFEKHDTGVKYLNFKVKKLRKVGEYVSDNIAED